MDNILHRSNLRGIVKCKQCNHFNGVRARSCKNKLCSLSQVKVQRKPKAKIDTIQLITNNDSKLYSVQIRDRDVEHRNFVSITDKIISSDENGSIISRNAICYIDTCKYDSNDVNISCKHVKSSLELCSAHATRLEISMAVLNSMKIGNEQRNSFWKMYNDSESSTPLVQRINRTMFVVGCKNSIAFPAGLLHVTININNDSANYLCACKKIKILMSPNNSIVLENEKCDHILITIAAIMSNAKLIDEFRAHLKLVADFLDTNTLNKVPSKDLTFDFQNHCTNVETSFLTENYDCATVSSTLIDNLDNIALIQIPNVLTDENHILSDNSNQSDDTNQKEMESVNVENIRIINETNSNDDVNLEGLELIDCQVELMDQFKLTDNVELCDMDDAVYLSDNQIDYFGMDAISDMPEFNTWTNEHVDFLNLYENDTKIEDDKIDATDGHINQQRRPKNESLLTMKSTTHSTASNGNSNDDLEDIMLEQSNPNEHKLFLNWLNSVIETINLTMDYSDDGHPDPLVFSLPHLYFEMLKTKFSVGTKKKRLPSCTILISDGKYEGLTLFEWSFSNIKLIQYIFQTDDMSIEIIRSFYETSPGIYQYVEHNENITKNEPNQHHWRKIRPKEYKTFLKAKNNVGIKAKAAQRTGLFIIEWIPNVLPKSNYGEMRIKFQFGHMTNNRVVKL